MSAGRTPGRNNKIGINTMVFMVFPQPPEGVFQIDKLFREGGITSMRDALNWTFSHPISTVIVGCDNVEQLEENISVATEFEPLAQQELDRISSLTAHYPKEAAFFKRDGAGFPGRRDNEDDQQTDG